MKSGHWLPSVGLITALLQTACARSSGHLTVERHSTLIRVTQEAPRSVPVRPLELIHLSKTGFGQPPHLPLLPGRHSTERSPNTEWVTVPCSPEGPAFHAVSWVFSRQPKHHSPGTTLCRDSAPDPTLQPVFSLPSGTKAREEFRRAGLWSFLRSVRGGRCKSGRVSALGLAPKKDPPASEDSAVCCGSRHGDAGNAARGCPARPGRTRKSTCEGTQHPLTRPSADSVSGNLLTFPPQTRRLREYKCLGPEPLRE